MLRLLALYPLEYLDEQTHCEYTWRSNYGKIEFYDQASKGQIVVLSALETRKQHSSLDKVSSGANREDKLDGQITERAPVDTDLRRDL